MAAKETATVRSIARHLGLSPATVSLTLNGHRPTGFVSVATRKQVWKTAEEMGYPLARLRSRRSSLERVAVFSHTGRNTVYSESLLELCRILNQQKVQVLTHSLRTEQEAQEAAREMYRRQEIDAAVFVGSLHDLDSPVTTDKFDGLPCVFIGEVPDGSNVWQVRPDNEGGGRAAGEHLWSLGHRSVGMVLLDSDVIVGQKRLNGLRAFWEEQGSSLPESHIIRMDVGSDTAIRAAIARFVPENRRAESPITALFCFNDWIAGIVIKALHNMDVRVPDELSVVGFDNSVYAELLDPSLTTVHQPFDQLGILAAEILLSRVESGSDQPTVEVARCQLISRQSCGIALQCR